MSLVRKLVFSFLPLFLLLSSNTCATHQTLDNLILKADGVELHSDPLWHAMLELKQGVQINPERMTLSSPFSPRKELISTLSLLLNDRDGACRFPGRARFIERALQFDEGALFSTEHCTDYQLYVDSVPSESVFLVFASESITSASSMMGHAMLRFDGTNASGLNVKHGITFFTELNSLNIPHLLYETLISGREGIFKVAPYAPYQHFYRVTEQRNVWEYKLSLTALERQVMRDRVWELQFENPDYFFDKYNCATLTHLLLALTRPDSIGSLDRIITPLDVVRYIHDASLVAQTRLIPSDKWKVQSLAQNLPLAKRQRLYAKLMTGDVETISSTVNEADYLAFEYLKGLNALLLERGEIDSDTFALNQSRLESNSTHYDGFSLSVEESVSALHRDREARFSVGMQYFENETFATLDYYPVANSLSNDNRSVFGETQLILSEIGLRVSAQTGDIFVDRLMLYNMVSRIPYELENPNLSTSFSVGIDRIYDNTVAQRSMGVVEGAVGVTKTFGRRAGIYSEMGMGFTTDLNGLNIFLAPRVGAYAYLAEQAKINLEYRANYNRFGEQNVLQVLNTAMHYEMSDGFQLGVNVELVKSHTETSSLTEIRLHYRF